MSGLMFNSLEILICFLTVEHSEEIAHSNKPVQAHRSLSRVVLAEKTFLLVHNVS